MFSFDIKEADTKRKGNKPLTSVDAVIDKYNKRLRDDAKEVALGYLATSLEQARGRWIEGKIRAEYKGAKCWTISGKRKKLEEVNKGDIDTLGEELVHVSIKVGKISMDFSKEDGTKAPYYRVRGRDVPETLQKFITAIENNANGIQDVLHEMNKKNRETAGGKDSVKTYSEKHDRYLTKEGVEEIDAFLARSGLPQA
jgi:hypothetical protein